MQPLGSEGPDIVKGRKERERRQEEMNGWPWQRHGVHQRGSKELQGARVGIGVGRWGESTDREQACVGHSLR